MQLPASDVVTDLIGQKVVFWTDRPGIIRGVVVTSMGIRLILLYRRLDGALALIEKSLEQVVLVEGEKE